MTFIVYFLIFQTFSLINFRTDTDNELQLIQTLARGAGAYDAVVATHFSQGGAGAALLASALEKACQQPSNFQFLYDLKVGRILSLNSPICCLLGIFLNMVVCDCS